MKRRDFIKSSLIGITLLPFIGNNVELIYTTDILKLYQPFFILKYIYHGDYFEEIITVPTQKGTLNDIVKKIQIVMYFFILKKK